MVPVRAYRGVRRAKSRHKVEHYLPLDIRKLHHYGLLRPGSEGSVLLTSADGRWAATASFRTAAHKLTVVLEGVARSVPTEIRVESTVCRFGGRREWLCCPRCNSRRAILYGLDDAGSFSCRCCMGLVYGSQDETKMDRLRRKQNRIEAKLTGPYRCARPRGMHRETFCRITLELDAVLVKQERLRAASARKFFDRYGWPSSYGGR